MIRGTFVTRQKKWITRQQTYFFRFLRNFRFSPSPFLGTIGSQRLLGKTLYRSFCLCIDFCFVLQVAIIFGLMNWRPFGLMNWRPLRRGRGGGGAHTQRKQIRARCGGLEHFLMSGPEAPGHQVHLASLHGGGSWRARDGSTRPCASSRQAEAKVVYLLLFCLFFDHFSAWPKVSLWWCH